MGSALLQRPQNDSQTDPSSQPLQPPQPAPAEDNGPQKKVKVQDPNMSNPRLLVNRACIYERQLPSNAYITAHVARLQHGYYSSNAVSDRDAECVDFLAISFVFHTPNTLSHRFKAATIRVSVHGNQKAQSSPKDLVGYPQNAPRFLMHAPHLIYGHVSPETMEWAFSLAGSLGISETPVSAKLAPSGSLNSQYRRYEMMRIQGSARSLKSPRGRGFDIEAGEVVWSLEENHLQRSGLPREFTFVMLIQKPAANSNLTLSLEIDPVLQALCGSYPSWLLSCPPYRPQPRGGVDFRQEVGQRFEPADTTRGFNFAALDSSFDEYIAMPGRQFTRQMNIPEETPLPANNNLNLNYPQFSNGYNMQPAQYNWAILQNQSLQPQLHELHTNAQMQQSGPSRPTHRPAPVAIANEEAPNTVNINLGLDTTTISYLSSLFRARNPPATVTRVLATSHHDPTLVSSSNHNPVEVTVPSVTGFESYENIRASMLRTVHPGFVETDREPPSNKAAVAPGEEPQRVMNMANRPLSPDLLSRLANENKR